jgi:hypothetical protein
VTIPFTSATASGAVDDVENPASGPPAPDDDVQEMSQPMVIVVRKW